MAISAMIILHELTLLVAIILEITQMNVDCRNKAVSIDSIDQFLYRDYRYSYNTLTNHCEKDQQVQGWWNALFNVYAQKSNSFRHKRQRRD